MRKVVSRALLAAALLVTALVAVPAPAFAGGWGATVTEYNADGRAERFWVGSDGAVWHAWASTPGGPINSGNYSLGGHVTSGVGVTRNQDGRLEIFGRADGGDLNHKWQLSPGGSWSGWASLGGQLRPRTGVYADYFSRNGGTIRVKVTGVDGRTRYKWQLAPNCCWGDWV
ncbi:hypothetical protein SAMN05421505_106185 [Sinosporangium album]|uniref:PLL-like beta propeller domain-containing protein n=1 Tax=Sinosporangium album TaxID=504805 RepID=A0A1G7W3S7_9ACTN|nr:hypothetical protein [Sinosporangium album]SDG66587.1 hypothetical protein SAMN05421505_106185 [Sinosporangium album]